MAQPMHSHGPGQPMHSHGPAPPQQMPPQGMQQQQQQQKMVIPQPDPIMQAVIEASFTPVDVAFGPPDNVTAVCSKHALEKCTECDADYVNLNRLSRLLQMNPTLRCPPPPQMLSQKLSQAINNTKEEGNVFFKAGQHEKAIQKYTMAANFAAQRPPWEAAQLMREELSAILSNRSASFLESGDFINALVDADQVISLKRAWGKGHFRKAKALLKLESYHEAKEAIELGLEFEPENAEMVSLRNLVQEKLREQHEAKIRRATNGAV